MGRSEQVIIEDTKGEILHESAFRADSSIQIPNPGERIVIGDVASMARRREGRWENGREFIVRERRLCLHATGSLTYLVIVEPIPGAKQKKSETSQRRRRDGSFARTADPIEV